MIAHLLHPQTAYCLVAGPCLVLVAFDARAERRRREAAQNSPLTSP